MEQTLGKRIATLRKNMKLTQDQLAERLGLTAQAISKWENDQSCPDITMLPRLAEIFGITTDELLGMERPNPVHTAEVVEEEQENEGVHIHNGNWEFKWDSGKKDAVTFAILILWVGILILAAKHFGWNDSFWEILWPSALLIYGGRHLLGRFSIFSACVTLCGAYFLIDNLEIWQLELASEYVFPIAVVLIGLGLLFDALKKPKKPRFVLTHNGKKVGSGENKTTSEFTTDGDRFDCSLSFGEKSHQVNIPVLAGGVAAVSFGELHVDLTGCEAVQSGCTIDANCSFGELEILVPKRFRIENHDSTAFASIEISGHPDEQPEGTIYLNSNVSFGEISVRYL